MEAALWIDIVRIKTRTRNPPGLLAIPATKKEIEGKKWKYLRLDFF